MLAQPARPLLVFVLIVLTVWFGGLAAAARMAGAFGSGHDYNVPLWIARNLSIDWLNRPAGLLGGGFAPATDAQLVDFFGRASAVGAAETDLAYARATNMPPQTAERDLLERLTDVEALRRPVQLRLSSELEHAALQAGLGTKLPGFPAFHFLWPPVSFAYDLPPNLLVRSPRDRIELQDATLLSSKLSETDRRRILQEAERGGDSALIVRVGGIATYPSIVEEDDDYATGLELIAHEWTHQYLAFQPLGARYFQSRELTTMNETVANLVGQDLATEMRSQFPLPAQPARSTPTVPPPDRSIDFDKTMHELRQEVDSLLAEGKEAAAEERMEDTHRFLIDHGYYVSDINQAYFAFYGSYANTSASTSPIGPQLADLRGRYPTLAGFVHAVQDVRSERELSALLKSSAR